MTFAKAVSATTKLADEFGVRCHDQNIHTADKDKTSSLMFDKSIRSLHLTELSRFENALKQRI